MTDTEVYAHAVASAIFGDQSKFAADEAKKAFADVSALTKVGKCDADTADRVRTRLSNQSAARQHLEKHGLLVLKDDAASAAIRQEIERLTKELEKLS